MSHTRGNPSRLRGRPHAVPAWLLLAALAIVSATRNARADDAALLGPLPMEVGDLATAAPAGDRHAESLPLGTPRGPSRSATGGAGPAGSAPARSLVPPTSDLAPTLTALAGVVGLIVLLAGGIRLARGGRAASIDTSRSPSGILEVLGRYPISGGATLLLLRADRRVLLISQARASRLGGSTLTTLAEFAGVEEVASILAQARDARDESISARFSSLLAGFSAEHREDRDQAALLASHGDSVLGEGVPLDAEPEQGRWQAEPASTRASGSEPPQTEERPRYAGSLLRRRLDDLRVWEGATA